MPLRYLSAPPDVSLPPLTIRHLLSANELSAAHQEIVYCDQNRLTYGQFRQRIARLAGMLESLGVVEGTTVAILDWDSHRYLEAYFAVPMMGAVLHTVNIQLAPAQIQYTLDHASAEVLLVHHDFLTVVAELRPSLRSVRHIVAIMDGTSSSPPSWSEGEYEALMETAQARPVFDDFDENALATTFYTTGTTGLPNAVGFSHRQLVLHTLAVAAVMGTILGPAREGGGVYMPLTPMFHVHAWGMPYAATMLGLKQVYPGRYDADTILRLRLAEQVTVSHCVPTILQMLVTAAEQSGERLDGWSVTIGGSALTRDLFDQATAADARVVAGYGMSETCPMIAVGRPGLGRYEAIRSGVPVPLVSARVVGPDMESLAPDDIATGELLVRAPWLTTGYLGDEDASAALWAGGWMQTQDLATVSPTGSIQIRDRLKDVIKTGGEWISSLALEDLIIARSDISEVAVLGVPDAIWQERPIAVVIPRAGECPTTADVRTTLMEAVTAGKISRYALVEEVICVAELPRTSVGKIDKKVIRAMIASRGDIPTHGGGAENEGTNDALFTA